MADTPQTPDTRETPQDTEPAGEHAGAVRKGYDAAREPERQGDGDPGTEPPPEGGDSHVPG